jgi:hypothetical protein
MNREGSKSAVTLFDWHTQGHHPTYLSAYAESFLQLGKLVNIGTTENDWLEAALSDKGYRAGQDFVVTKINNFPWLTRKKSVRAKLKNLNRKRIFINSLRVSIREGQKKLGVDCKQIHIACIYENEASLLDRAIKSIKYPASALYLQGHTFHQTSSAKPNQMLTLLQNEYLKSVLTLDELIGPKIKAVTSAHVIQSPDFTNIDLAPDTLIESQIEEKLGQRPRIALMGYLIKSKGLLELCQLVVSGELSQHGIIIAGEVKWKEFTTEEAKMIREACFSQPNVWAKLERLETEGAYNALLKNTHVVLAAYQDFPHSSNTLCKAAHLKKPIVVNDIGVMAQRVRDYKIGEITHSHSKGALLASINRITKDLQAWEKLNKPKWDSYVRAHSRERLNDTLASVVELIETGNGNQLNQSEDRTT